MTGRSCYLILTLGYPDRLARDDMSQKSGAQRHGVSQEGSEGRVVNLGEGFVGRGEDGGRGNAIDCLL